MLKWTATFFVIAMAAAIFAFNADIDRRIASIAKSTFFISIGLTFISAVIGAAIKKHRTD
jgi:uncharacterized membrane protein YtjA (UPF0391 family)